MTALIMAEGLTKAYGSNVAVKDFDLQVAEGEVVALLGGARTGKSTILKMLSADVKPDDGIVRTCGYDTVMQAGLVRPRIGVVQHERFLEPGLTGRENLAEQAMLRFFTPDDAERRIAELLALVPLDSRLDDNASSYAPHEWMVLELTACLIHRPSLLLVDEPTRGCDAQGRALVWETLRQLRPQVSGMVFTTADADEAHALADRIVNVSLPS